MLQVLYETHFEPVQTDVRSVEIRGLAAARNTGSEHTSVTYKDCPSPTGGTSVPACAHQRQQRQPPAAVFLFFGMCLGSRRRRFQIDNIDPRGGVSGHGVHREAVTCLQQLSSVHK